jgi:hypothetical protein
VPNNPIRYTFNLDLKVGISAILVLTTAMTDVIPGLYGLSMFIQNITPSWPILILPAILNAITIQRQVLTEDQSKGNH